MYVFIYVLFISQYSTQIDLKTIVLHVLFLIWAFRQLLHNCLLIHKRMHKDITVYCVWMYYFLTIDTKCTWFFWWIVNYLIIFLVIHSFILFVNYSLIFYSLGVRDMVGKVIQLAAEDSTQNKDGQSSVVIICGTGYIMPDARLELGIKEPRYLPPSTRFFTLCFVYFCLHPLIHLCFLQDLAFYYLIQLLFASDCTLDDHSIFYYFLLQGWCWPITGFIDPRSPPRSAPHRIIIIRCIVEFLLWIFFIDRRNPHSYYSHCNAYFIYFVGWSIPSFTESSKSISNYHLIRKSSSIMRFLFSLLLNSRMDIQESTDFHLRMLSNPEIRTPHVAEYCTIVQIWELQLRKLNSSAYSFIFHSRDGDFKTNDFQVKKCRGMFYGIIWKSLDLFHFLKFLKN